MQQGVNQEIDKARYDGARIILFGGTFEPPHIGHLTIARVALEQTGADEVWLIPAPSPPHKEDVGLAYKIRADMVSALIRDTPGLRLVGIEEQLPVPSYTVDTVRLCKTLYPQTQFEFLIGTDSLATLAHWERARTLSEEIAFLVVARTGYPFQATYEQVQQRLPHLRARLIEMPILDLSSTWLRNRLQSGKPLCGLVPDNVLSVWQRGTSEHIDTL